VRNDRKGRGIVRKERKVRGILRNDKSPPPNPFQSEGELKAGRDELDKTPRSNQ